VDRPPKVLTPPPFDNTRFVDLIGRRPLLLQEGLADQVRSLRTLEQVIAGHTGSPVSAAPGPLRGQLSPFSQLHDLAFSDGSVFMGLAPGTLQKGLSQGSLWYDGKAQLGQTYNSVSYIGNLYEAYAGSWFNAEGSAIAVFRSSVFNAMQERGHAGIEKIRGTLRYPFLMEGLPLEAIDYIFVNPLTAERQLLFKRVATEPGKKKISFDAMGKISRRRCWWLKLRRRIFTGLPLNFLHYSTPSTVWPAPTVYGSPLLFQRKMREAYRNTNEPTRRKRVRKQTHLRGILWGAAEASWNRSLDEMERFS